MKQTFKPTPKLQNFKTTVKQNKTNLNTSTESSVMSEALGLSVEKIKSFM